MKIGLVGYLGCGKSSLFQWLTGTAPDPAHAHVTQSAMATVPEPRVEPLCRVYQPKKVTLAALEIVDTPGISRTHEGSAQRLALIREAGCLVIVVAAHTGGDPAKDLESFDEDLLLADLEILGNRLQRIAESLEKPRPHGEREELIHEQRMLEPLRQALESGQALHQFEMSPEQRRAIRSFQLFSEKPRLVVVNTADDEGQPERFAGCAPPGIPVFMVSLALEAELASMPEEERAAFCREMQVQSADRDAVVRQLMETSGQMLFFTAGDKEVRTWMIHKGGTALDAAEGIHTDLAKGFIRAETITCEDLIRLGSEREVKAHNLMRHEHKDYVIQDGDILFIRHH